MSQINTKAFVKAIKDEAYNYGISLTVRDRLSGLGVQFAERRWSDKKGDYKGTLKVVGGPETLNTYTLLTLASEIPAAYPRLRDAVNTALTVDDVPTPADTEVHISRDGMTSNPTGDVPVSDFLATLRQWAADEEWCYEAEESLSVLDLRVEDNSHVRFTLVAGSPETITRDQIAQYVRWLRENYEDTASVRRFARHLESTWPVAGTTTAPAPVSGGDFQVTIDARLTHSQLGVLGWDGTSPLDGCPINYSGITGRITRARRA